MKKPLGYRFYKSSLDFGKFLPSPFGRGAGGEGMANLYKLDKAIFYAKALTLTLSQWERGL
jgi:hypothetical protein